MIAECALDLVARVKTVAALTNSSGMALGGRGADPQLTKIPLPAAWIMFSLHQVDEAPFGATSRVSPGLVPAVEVTLATFTVTLYVPYIDEADLTSTQLPLLESVIAAVKSDGGQAPSGHRWRFLGQKLALVYPDRLAYQQHYTLHMAL